MQDLLWLIPALPLLGFLCNGLVGQLLGRRIVATVGCSTIGAAFLLSVAAFLAMLDSPQGILNQLLFTWIDSGTLNVPVAFSVDRLSALYLLVITGVGLLIHIYAAGYLEKASDFARFYAYLNLFVFFMLLLVMASGLLFLFVGWEGVGLCSYLLIGFEHHRPAAASAAKKAFVVNRIGDFGFVIATLMTLVAFGTLEFAAVNAQAALLLEANTPFVIALTLMLMLGAAGKSAQIPLYVWLPDAMEGPTPVSALIHAATMVTAGLYLVARLSALFVLAPFTMGIVAAVGAATALFAATIGLAQYDIKKVLAYSTVSQLGYMFMAMGVGAFVSGIFHVLTHAFFKALLFLAAGSVIRRLHHEQDMRRMGGLIRQMPITGWCYIVGALAISGFPFFSGFFSKDEILWYAFSSPLGHPLLWVIGTGTAALTAFYMFRSVALTFFGESHLDKKTGLTVRESHWIMTAPLCVLAGLAVVGGWIGVPHVLGDLVHLPNSIEHYFDGFFPVINSDAHHQTNLELALMGISTLLALAAMYTAFLLYSRRLGWVKLMQAHFARVHNVLLRCYFVDALYERTLVRGVHVLAQRLLWRIVDVRMIDGAVNGTGLVTRALGLRACLVQNGIAGRYALAIVLGVIFVLWRLVF